MGVRGRNSRAHNVTKAQLEDLYVMRGLSTRACAAALGWPTHGGITWWLRKYGIHTRLARFQKGNRKAGGRPPETYGSWKGGKQVTHCDQCGKALKRFPSQIHERNFCDHSCRGKSRRFQVVGQVFGSLTVIGVAPRDNWNHLQWRCVCKCGREKLVKTSDLNGGRVKSCGCAANAKGEANRQWKGGKIRVPCGNPGCNKTRLTYPARAKMYETVYCSSRCYGIHKGERVKGKKNPRYVEKNIVACDYCGKALELLPCKESLYQKHFCNTACAAKWRSEHIRGEASRTWRGGLSFEPYTRDWSEALRESIRKRDGRRCRVCGILEKGKHHEVHHIDYDKENLAPNNLVALCRSCHSRTNYHRSQWQRFFYGVGPTSVRKDT